MSYWMSIRAKQAPTVTEILEALATPELRSTEFPNGFPTEFWPTGVSHYYRANLSARGVELTFEPGFARIQILSLSNPEDWELGFRLLCALAADPATQVEGQEGTLGTVADMRERFLEVIRRWIADEFRVIQKQVREHDNVLVSMHGPHREVFFGRRSLQELSTGTTELVTAVIERIRRIQYIETEGYEVVRPVKLAVDPGRSATSWNLDKTQVFEATDYVGLDKPYRRATVYVPVPDMPKLVGSRLEWLDEKQFILHAVPKSEQAAIHARAKAMVVIYHPPKRWWQFWR